MSSNQGIAPRGTLPHVVCETELPFEAYGRLRHLGLDITTIPHQGGEWDFAPLGLPCPDVLLCKRPPRDVARMAELRWVQIATVGYEHLRHHGFADSPTVVTNARGIFDTALAEWNVGMMLALMRDLRSMMRDQGNNLWRRESRYQQEVRGKVVGLWGYGGLGRETARVARALGMTVHVLTRNGVRTRKDAYTPAGTGDPEGTLPHRAFSLEEKPHFLHSLDFLILGVPHTKASDGMVGAEELSSLKRGAFLLNPARGPIVQEAALLDALRKGHLGGAALDTHFAYPLPADHPLWRFPNVIITPHIAGADRSSLFPGRMAELFEANARRWLAGERLLNRVSRQEWLEA
jgi:phosphoglycerate dehydrogenase-like enzyme